MKHRHWIYGLIIAFILGIAAWTVRATPILQSRPQLSPEHQSLRDLGVVRVDVPPIRGDLTQLGVTTEHVAKVFKEEIQLAGFQILDDPHVPLIRLVAFSNHDEDQPEALAITFVIAFHQEISVKRIDQDLWAPTAFFSQTKLTTRQEAHDRIDWYLRKATARVMRIASFASEIE